MCFHITWHDSDTDPHIFALTLTLSRIIAVCSYWHVYAHTWKTQSYPFSFSHISSAILVNGSFPVNGSSRTNCTSLVNNPCSSSFPFFRFPIFWSLSICSVTCFVLYSFVYLHLFPSLLCPIHTFLCDSVVFVQWFKDF